MGKLTPEEQAEINRHLKAKATHLRRIRKSRVLNLIVLGIAWIASMGIMALRYKVLAPMGIYQRESIAIILLPVVLALIFCGWNYFRQ